MNQYRLRAHSLTIPRRIHRMTVLANSPDEARIVARIRNPDFGTTLPGKDGVRLVGIMHHVADDKASAFASDQSWRCRFCHRYVIDGLYTRVSFPDGVANVCDNCHEKRDEDTATWRDTEVEVI